jgi:hypothetical protein
MPISDDGPLYVIVHRSHGYKPPRDQVYDVHADHDLDDVRGRAAGLEHDAQNLHGRTKDTYRVAELRFVDPTT